MADYVRAYARLRDTTATLDWLDSMNVYHDSFLHIARVDPFLDFVRSQPRYRAWEASSGLPPRARRAGLQGEQDEQVGRVNR
jgi:hypothetical protein